MTGRWAVLAVAAACALLLLGRCGAAGGPASPAAARGGPGFNPTDVMFLQMMAPHEGQGVTLARLATGRGRVLRPEVARLAAAIASTQLTEVRAMSARLRAWHRPATAAPGSHAAHGGLPTTSPAAVRSVERAPADRFERAFLNLLIAHQDDAVQMARMETAHGEDAWARSLAATIDRSRSAEIAAMLALLDPRSR
ncbi:DUF305 domain-containing protein [Actinomadura gamaensis]|uniref:DUF305 domain-containing protein n=1 Tax=Actinomadura gamaensis TaxID=1763541 RepID=A0ABV9TR46_9ACTN